jgi:serine protease Do
MLVASRNRKRVGRTVSVLVVASLVALSFSLVVAAENDSEFAPAVSHAQTRMVKIFGAGIGRSPGYGTGLIVSPEGDIITSQGVFLSTTNLRVITPDGETHIAKVVRRSQNLQAALLKIDAKTPDYFDLAEPADVEVGDWILGVSNCFKVADGTEPLSVNVGVLQLKTHLEARRGVQDFPYNGEVLLIDAITSNPGAAGGAVVSVDGKLAGMIGKVIEGKNTNTRLNYAVPTHLLHDFLTRPDEVATTENPAPNDKPGDLGIRLFALAGRKGPAFVDRVVANSPAATAGIKSDDLVISLDGKPIKNSDDFAKAIATIKSGQEVAVIVKRKNDLVSVQLTAAPK